MGPLGWQETIFIFLLALLIFGPKKLPELGKTIGKAMTEFRRASSELKGTFDREMSNLERETEIKEVASSINESINHDTYNYDSASYYDSGNYNYESGHSIESTATETSTASASAPQGAESTIATPPEGTIPSGSVPSNGADGVPAHTAEAQPVTTTAEPKAV